MHSPYVAVNYSLMKIAFILLFIFTFTYTNGQSKADTIYGRNLYYAIPELKVINKLTLKNIAGRYFTTDGYCGYSLILDSNSEFQIRHNCCTFDSLITKGEFYIRDNQVMVTLHNAYVYYDVISCYEHCYFLISEKERNNFTRDLLNIKAKLSNKLSSPKKKWEAETIILNTLSHKYYQKLGVI